MSSTDLAPTLQRVHALLDRASHETTPEEEARTSALIAARLIRQHGLRVVHPLREEKPNPRVKSDPKKRRSSSKEVPEDAVGRRIMARYDGRCRGCKRAFFEGDYIVWVMNYGAWHPVCWDDLSDPW